MTVGVSNYSSLKHKTIFCVWELIHVLTLMVFIKLSPGRLYNIPYMILLCQFPAQIDHSCGYKVNRMTCNWVLFTHSGRKRNMKSNVQDILTGNENLDLRALYLRFKTNCNRRCGKSGLYD
jgi:hypothetical protein